MTSKGRASHNLEGGGGRRKSKVYAKRICQTFQKLLGLEEGAGGCGRREARAWRYVGSKQKEQNDIEKRRLKVRERIAREKGVPVAKQTC